MKFILTDYINFALESAEYDKLEDSSFCGRIPKCKGVIAFASSLRECEEELHSTLEDWIFVGMRLGHHIPVINGISLNRSVCREPAPLHVNVESSFASYVNLDLAGLLLVENIIL